MAAQVFMCMHLCARSYVTIAGAIAHYYWTRGDRDKMPRHPILCAMRNTFR